MSHAYPSATHRRGILGRRVLGVPVVAVVAVVAAAGVALAAYLARANFSGTVKGGSFSASWTTVGPASGPAGCPSLTVDSGVLSSTGGSGIYPGESCTYTASLVATGADGTVAGVAAPVSPQTGWSLSVESTSSTSTPGSACGVPLQVGTPKQVQVTIGRPGSALADGATLALTGYAVQVSTDTSGPVLSTPAASCVKAS